MVESFYVFNNSTEFVLVFQTCAYIQRINERKLNLFGHISRMEDSRLVKEVVFREMQGKTTRREWLDDVKEWCNEEINILKRKAQDRDTWEKITKCANCALDTKWNNG